MAVGLNIIAYLMIATPSWGCSGFVVSLKSWICLLALGPAHP